MPGTNIDDWEDWEFFEDEENDSTGYTLDDIPASQYDPGLIESYFIEHDWEDEGMSGAKVYTHPGESWTAVITGNEATIFMPELTGNRYLELKHLMAGHEEVFSIEELVEWEYNDDPTMIPFHEL